MPTLQVNTNPGFYQLRVATIYMCYTPLTASNTLLYSSISVILNANGLSLSLFGLDCKPLSVSKDHSDSEAYKSMAPHFLHIVDLSWNITYLELSLIFLQYSANDSDISSNSGNSLLYFLPFFASYSITDFGFGI